jgi:mRNA-degrading endonuclease RelE of RelBE toxin-antitoxin system
VYNKFIQTVIETPEFVAWAKSVWSDDERLVFIDWISENPQAGDVIPGAVPLRKVRWSRAGMGKRGGARVIYFLQRPNGEVVLILVYSKAKFDQLSDSLLLQLKEKFDANSK